MSSNIVNQLSIMFQHGTQGLARIKLHSRSLLVIEVAQKSANETALKHH